jgi:hypothetical protein
VMGAAKRDREFIARLAAQRPRLHKSDVMGLRGFAAAQYAGLLGYEPQVFLVALALWRADGEHALIDPSGLMCIRAAGLPDWVPQQDSERLRQSYRPPQSSGADPGATVRRHPLARRVRKHGSQIQIPRCGINGCSLNDRDLLLAQRFADDLEPTLEGGSGRCAASPRPSPLGWSP